jgi:DNA replication protein DnaC
MSIEHTLPLLLKQLRLSVIGQHWSELSNTAEKEHWCYSKYLGELAHLELATREQNRIQRRIKESKLPSGKTMDSFDFKIIPSINPAQFKALAENSDWVKQAHNLLIFGPSGVGKTHLAAAIGYDLIQQGVRVLFSTTTAMVQRLQKARKQYQLQELMNKLDRFELLILDDIGYVQKNNDETSVLFELISERYERKSLLITSNHAFDKWDNIFPDSMMAVAAIDRIVHHATIIDVQGESFRKSETSKLRNITGGGN